MSIPLPCCHELATPARLILRARYSPLWPSLGLAVLTLIAVLAESAWTQEERPSPKLDPLPFNIPTQPLAGALQAYSQATGVEVLYESSIATGLQSTDVAGTFTPKQALGVLLTGTDIVVHYTRSNAITLTLPSFDYDPDLPPAHPLAEADFALDTLRVTAGGQQPDQGRLREFSESVQADIEGALRKDTRTRSGNYRASVKLWVDPSRTVRRAELAQSTGDTGRDLTIAEVLQGLVLRSGPPANTPQPVRVVIVVRSL
jgi:hypothetical protein